jgi:hypothetical protein
VATPYLHPLACSKCGAPLSANPGQQLLRCDYCGSTHAFLPPPPPEAPTIEFRPGERVAIEWGGQWWPGTIVASLRPGVWRVHYEGWAASYDEEVDRSRLRHAFVSAGAPPRRLRLVAAGALLAAAVCGAVVVAASAPSSGVRAPASGNPVLTYAAGQEVRIEWGRTWWKGRIVAVHAKDRYLVHYDGWSSSWDEVVGPERLAPP